MIDDWEKAWGEYYDKTMERLGWIGAFLVILGYYFNAHQHLSCWGVWIAGNLCVAGYSAHKKAYSTLLMSLIITGMNIYGYFSWIDN
jgi:nicotinamide riboside transporter PnuC